MNIEKLESISKIIAAIFIPIAIAYMGNELAANNKKKETETKLVELATVILSKEAGPNQSAESRNIRKWAVDVINTYSGVPMSVETKTALINSTSLPSVTKTTDDVNSTFGVVFGADKTIDEANYEVSVKAKKIGVDNAQIFLRSGLYRSVAVYPSRAEAEEALGKLKQLRQDSFVVDMTKWCPNTTRQSQYFECKI